MFQNAEDAKSPTSESPKTEKPETPAAEIAPVLNGDASKEEIVDTPKPDAVPTEEPKQEEPKVEETKPEEPKVEAKPEEPKVEPKVEETNNSELVESAPKEPIPVKTPVEETKEVRNEEVPPPLPSSNPPSSLTAFAESTKADILNTDTIDLLQVTSVDPVLEKKIGEPLLEQNIVESKHELKTTSPSESLPVSSLKCEIEPNLKTSNLPKSEPLIESVDSEKSLGDLITAQQELSLKSELTQKPEKSDTLVELKSEDKPILTESATVVMQSQICEPSFESCLQESKATEEPLVQEIISVVSSETSDSSIPMVVDDPLPERSTIELNLKPLPLVENEQNLEAKDLQSKTDLDVIQPRTESEVSEIPDPVDVKKIPENIALISQEDFIEPTQTDIISQESLSSGFIKAPKTSEENNKEVIEDLKGPQLTPVELVIEDAKPQIIEQLPSEQSLNYSEESESIDLPPPESDLPQAGFVEENKSDLPPAPPAPITSEECPVDLPSPTDLPPPSTALVDPTDSLQDISTESLPSLPEPLSENLAEPMSLPPVDSLPEPIATDCLPPETTSVTANSVPLESNQPTAESEPLTAEPSSLVSELVSLAAEPVPLAAEPVPLATELATLPTEPILLATEIITVATDSITSESDPLPPTECPPVLTNGSVNGLVSPGEASPTTNGGSILLGEAAPLKQVIKT